MTDEHRLWMATRRRGLSHHLLRAELAADMYTVCGRLVASYGLGESGLIVTAADVEALDSPPCPRCWPQPAQPKQRPVDVVELPGVAA